MIFSSNPKSGEHLQALMLLTETSAIVPRVPTSLLPLDIIHLIRYYSRFDDTVTWNS